MRPFLCALTLTLVAPSALALPPDEAGRGFVDGANHHLGDASFLAHFGRLPGSGDGEKLRMHEHLLFVHDWLAARPATRPELAARRAELLGYLHEYIAAGVTPLNHDLPWRSPIFVDQLGHVCAVGYLIERSVSRALVETIAATHRYDFLEDIDLPEVQAWIAESGFTLEELASIQPGYMAPTIETWQGWDFSEKRPSDGPWQVAVDGVVTRGAWKRGQMDGVWTRTIEAEDGTRKLIGRGEFRAGRGTWTSFDGEGRFIAQGPYRKSFPAGSWRFFHPSGRIAAEGRMSRGQRIGRWSFYWDSGDAVPIAKGRFASGGRVSGTWKHFDAQGRLLAKTWDGARTEWDQILRMRMVPRAGLTHEVAEGTFAGDHHRIDMLAQGEKRLFVEEGYDSTSYYDGAGRQLMKGEDGHWTRSRCAYSPNFGRAAKSGNLDRVLVALLDSRHDEEAVSCDETEALDAASAVALEGLLQADGVTRQASPEFVRALVYDDGDPETPPPAYIDDLARVIASNMDWYVEWPHVDGAFARVFATLPGHFEPGASFEDPEVGVSSAQMN